MTTHPIDPLARGGYIVTVKRDGRPTKVKYVRTHLEALAISAATPVGTDVTITQVESVTSTPTGGAE